MKDRTKISFTKTRKRIAKKTQDLLKAGKETIEEIELRPVWERVKSAVEKGAKKTATTAKLAGVEYKIHTRKQELQKLLAELGGLVYGRLRENPRPLSPADSALAAMIDNIKDMNAAISELEKKVQSLKKAA
jgi:chromosome segregation ATPase